MSACILVAGCGARRSERSFWGPAQRGQPNRFMLITIVNQFYPPGLAATAPLVQSLAEHLADVGHEVTVITSRGDYLAGDSGHTGKTGNGVRIFRLWSPGFGKSSLAGRLIDYACFYLLALFRSFLLPPQDVFISLTTPPYIALASLTHRFKSRRTRFVLWNMDCYPETPESVGMLRPGGLISRGLRQINRFIFSRMDAIICLDTAMADLLQANYGRGRPLPTVVIPNWEPLALFPREQFEARQQAPPARLTILYHGNAGVGHEFDTVEQCARLLRDAPVTFRFVGGGKWWDWLRARQGRDDLPHWEVQPYVPKSERPALLAHANVALITLRPTSRGVMSPSKLHSNLAAGLPILYVGPPDTNVDECVRRFHCGTSVRNGDAAGAAEFIYGILASPSRLAAMSANARAAFEAAYNDARAFPLFDAVLERLTPDG
jgi:colanic acid biosynthesis glycosyl transferase WcaI